MLQGKKFILGISGGIAAYKCAQLTRLLVKEGAEVQVIMTKLAKQFITPLTMATLSKRPILVEFFDPENGQWNSHVDSGLWADAMIVAPATANTMGKMANGIADNLLITTYLSARCPVFVAPTMDLDMYQHPSTQRNMKTLRSYGNQLIEPNDGELASGLIGKGRMAEPEEIVKALNDYFQKEEQADFAGKNVLVSAGPTQEKIDPVRFIGNHSSGKMGYAIAEELASRGAKVKLVSGPTQLPVSHPNIERIDVVSADEMYKACVQNFNGTDAAVMTAAVADYTPVTKADEKIKRKAASIAIEMEATNDIAASLGKHKAENQILVGFALESQDAVANAQKKLEKKNLDFIVLNSLKDEGAGFNTDTNKITIIDNHNNIINYALKSKAEVAHDIVNELMSKMGALKK